MPDHPYYGDATPDQVARALLRPAHARRFPPSRFPAVNVAQVPQRSPLRYPGGKTWLIPHVREWLNAGAPRLLVEPFAGGGIVSLTAVMEGLADSALMVDLDRDVAAFWRAALEHGPDLADLVAGFEVTRANIEALVAETPASVLDHGFRTLVLNRTRRGGVLAPGASLAKNGENGQGVASRWYAATLARRLGAITEHRERISFYEGDGIRLLASMAAQDGAAFFIDPPYTGGGGKRAGSRLYSHHELDHGHVFGVLAEHRPNFLMTYDASEEIVEAVRECHFHAVTVEMKSGHHARLRELVISRDPLFA